MPRWSAFPHIGAYNWTAASLTEHWDRMHAGDAEPLPQDPSVLQAWALFHNGEFQAAVEAGLAAGGDGITAANKAACIHACYVEKREDARLRRLLDAAERARVQAQQSPHTLNAWYWQAYALGRYSQGISVARALAQGLGSRVKDALEHTLQMQPRHADAHIALAAFHAEVIDKVGSLIGGMTYGARKEAGLRHYQEAIRLNPEAPLVLIEYANGLVMLEGEGMLPQARKLLQQAASAEPLDAAEFLDVEQARTQLREVGR